MKILAARFGAISIENLFQDKMDNKFIGIKNANELLHSSTIFIFATKFSAYRSLANQSSLNCVPFQNSKA